MSKYVDEVIMRIREHPGDWKILEYRRNAIISDSIVIVGTGNTRVLSVLDLYIHGVEMPVSYFDRWKLEVAVDGWFKSLSLEMIQKGSEK